MSFCRGLARGTRLVCVRAACASRREKRAWLGGGASTKKNTRHSGTVRPPSLLPSITNNHHPFFPQVKKAIEKGNIEGAKIYAQNAIRKKGEALNYLKLASRLDAVVARLDTQAKMQGVTRSMAGIVKTLDKALAANNLDKVRLWGVGRGKKEKNIDRSPCDSPTLTLPILLFSSPLGRRNHGPIRETV